MKIEINAGDKIECCSCGRKFDPMDGPMDACSECDEPMCERCMSWEFPKPSICSSCREELGINEHFKYY